MLQQGDDQAHRQARAHAVGAQAEQGADQALLQADSLKNIKLVLEMFGLAPYFWVVVSGQEVVNSKPSPDIFLRAAQLLNLLPEECLFLKIQR